MLKWIEERPVGLYPTQITMATKDAKSKKNSLPLKGAQKLVIQ